jgi:hypothetical protein
MPWLAAGLTIPPLMRRELVAALRTLNPRKRRMRICWIGLGVSALFLLLNTFGLSVKDISRQWLFLFGLYIAIGETFQLTSGLFAQERENQSFGFLFLAGLKPAEIFFSKIAGAFLIASIDLLALIPFIAIPFLGGGLSLQLFSATLCCLPNILIFVLALSTLGSVLCQEESAANSVTIGIGATVCLITPAVYWLKELAGHRISTGWLVFSPAYGPWLVGRGSFNSAAAIEFWQNSKITFLCSLLIFTISAVILRGAWQNESVAGSSSFWCGGVERRQRLARWLDVNPFVWLAAHDFQPERLGWIFLGIIGLLWAGCWLVMGRVWLSVSTFFFTAVLLNLAFDGLFSRTAAKTLAHQRRSGFIELLLSTPLTEAEIVHGQVAALRELFKKLLVVILFLNSAMLLVGIFLRGWNWRALSAYLIIWTALLVWPLFTFRRAPWSIMWIAFNSGHPSFFMRRCGWVWFWNFYNLRHIFDSGSPSLGSNRFPTGSVTEFVVVLIIAVSAAAICFAVASDANEQRDRLIREFRSIAAEPLPNAKDPRFKAWNTKERFPQPSPAGLL